jgi:putative toxin-antitoxin system antitoxin component (TIGR02293 family)
MDELRESAALLGLSLRGAARDSDIAYLKLIEAGLPLASLEKVAIAFAPSDTSFKYSIIPKASFQRAVSARRLNSTQSVLLTRLASVWAQARRIWKSDSGTRDFFFRAHPLLSDRRPVDLVLENELGAQLVRSVLGRLEAGSAV